MSSCLPIIYLPVSKLLNQFPTIQLNLFRTCELLPPFVRAIQPEELWLYKYPHTESYISMSTLWILALSIPLTTILVFYIKTRNGTDVNEALWCLSLIISLNGAITNAIKVMVGKWFVISLIVEEFLIFYLGRPRPDYVHRCFPSGNYQSDIPCLGSYYLVNDGRKSFPSGHSSVAFSSFGFLSFYLAAKLKTFTVNKKGSGPRLLIVFCPLFFALCVAISRTCDYHHHWQGMFYF